MQTVVESGRLVKLDASKVLDEVLSGLGESLRGNEAAIDSYFNHPAAIACERSAAFHDMLVDMKRVEGVNDELMGRIRMIVQLALVAGFTLAQTIQPT